MAKSILNKVVCEVFFFTWPLFFNCNVTRLQTFWSDFYKQQLSCLDLNPCHYSIYNRSVDIGCRSVDEPLDVIGQYLPSPLSSSAGLASHLCACSTLPSIVWAGLRIPLRSVLATALLTLLCSSCSFCWMPLASAIACGVSPCNAIRRVNGFSFAG